MWALMAFFVGIGLWRVGWRFALFTLLAMLLIYGTGFWDQMVITLGLTLVVHVDQPAAGRSARHLDREEPHRRDDRAPRARPDADHAGLRLPDSGRDAVRSRPRAGDSLHRDFRHAAGGASHVARHQACEPRDRRSGAGVRLHAVATALQGAVSERAAVDHDRREPDHHDGALHGDHRVDGGRGRSRQRRAGQYSTARYRARLRKRTCQW